MLKMLLTSSLIAAILTSVLSLIISLLNRKGLRELEKIKFGHLFLVERFNALREMRSNIMELLNKEGSIEMQRMRKLSINDEKVRLAYIQEWLRIHDERVALFEKNSDYFDDDFHTVIDGNIHTLKQYKEKVRAAIDGKRSSEEQFSVLNKYVDMTNRFKEMLSKSINEQISIIRRKLETNLS